MAGTMPITACRSNDTAGNCACGPGLTATALLYTRAPFAKPFRTPVYCRRSEPIQGFARFLYYSYRRVSRMIEA